VRVLINSAAIERNLLAPNREDGQKILDALRSHRGQGGVAWTSDGYNVRLYE
jgi:hypothetical protein